MKTLSEQIREIIRQSSTSSYAIAREAGIDKSAMSRFMNGGNLTMGKLDQLASVLGVIVITEVSQVPRQLTKGRPTAKRETKKMIQAQQEIQFFATEDDAKAFAKTYAQDAHDNYFHSRRGVWAINSESKDEPGFLVYYNNNPYGPNKDRANESKRIVRRLKDLGIYVLAKGQAGAKLQGTSESYTISMVLGCSPDKQSEVSRIIEEEVRATRENKASI